jgi:TonB-linked SusC/RagA family outer membrane protein
MKKFGNLVCQFLLRHRKKLIIMRNTLLIVLISSLQVFAVDSYAQTKKISLDLKDATIKEVLYAIEKQSEFYFLFNSELIDVSKKVNITVQEEKVADILIRLFKNSEVDFLIKDRYIVLTPAGRSSGETFNLLVQQQGTVTGKVTDSGGQPLPGVSIVVKGTTQGTITDSDGNYNLTNIPTDAVLVFSFVGMRAQEVAVGNQARIDVRMEEETIGIEEVVAVGYGIQKKANLTGAVTQVEVDELVRSRPVSNIATAIQGSVPGLEITSYSGRPGDEPSINIRGVMSITGGSPLILVDNVPMDINNLNPADIESISVLKDAAASSIYGGRAAFGVILITTKRSFRNEPVRFNYTGNFTTSHAINLPDKASTMDMITAFKSWGNTSYLTGQDLDTWENVLRDYHANPSAYPEGETYVDGVLYRLAEENIFNKFMTNSFEQMHNFSFSGGSERSDYRVSLGYADEDGIMITDKDSYKKINTNLYLNTNLTDKLVSTSNILYSNDNRSTPANYGGLFNNSLRQGIWSSSGYYTDPNDGTQIPFNSANNYLEMERSNNSLSENMRFFQKLEYSFTEDLRITGEYIFSKINSSSISSASGNKYIDQITYTTSYYGNPSYYNRSSGESNYHALNIYANYEKTLKDHIFNLMVGTNQEMSKYSSFWARRNELLDKDNPSLATALGTMTNDESFSDYNISGYFGRFNYSFRNKYLFEANIRYDGSSKFPEKSRYGLFPSFSAGWILSEEPFMKSIDNIFSFLKIRGSWGEIGNQSISNYAYIPSMSTFNARWLDNSTSERLLTIGPPALVSASFTWETVRTQNLGFDMNFLDNKLNTTFDYFIRQTLDMLGPGAELPAVLGAEAPEKNVADLESKGWELKIDWRVRKSHDFGYSLGFNLSDNRAFVTNYDNEAGLLSQYYNGYEFGQIWGYVTEGFYTVDDFEPGTLDENLMHGTLKEGIPAFYTVINQNPGDIRFADLDDSGEIDPGSSTLSDPGDRKIIGNSRNRYQFGITGNVYFKNFDFSLFIQGVGKRDIWPQRDPNNNDIVDVVFWPYNDLYASLYKNQLDYWTPENTDAYYMRSYKGGFGNTVQSRNVQTRYLLNGQYLSLRNVELGYTLPINITERFGISQGRLFVSAENVFRLDHLPSGMDPEVTERASGKGGVYPNYRKISFGVNISF